MVTKSLELIFDFGSPNAYLTLKVLPELLERTGADLIITPCLLGGIFKATGNKAPMIQYAEAPAKLAYENLEMRRFIARHGLTKFRLNPHFPVNTLTIMRGAIVAEDEGNLDDYVDAVNRAMWEEGLKMDDPEIIATFLSANGFDGPVLLARTQEPGIKARLVANTDAAVARGVFGIPTFFVGDEMFFGKDRLGQVEEALA
ncbi:MULTISPECIES: 2-hydroxychromene-2-carboxylate isomerase [unclassified Sphingopyxis]|uniref:2-hydroxychromene-2-carboxylate isomerase n=1 Tax=unclassified Sphingopyxis TaxID=2614943 RepID=UPI00072FD768|nr:MULTISPECIES: 2-hydroxychromene-2-carboxylate isomerase [unclassified Sphingopyxis]KTE26595.1 disulfide bond formation protein DsbA [Sphingopyxis sp. H057]KTE53001.1 disulfide bond formation protein DsbA [Sphingopyxis sp. H073]KTE55191.1 disulfide bond formation protein DsbA [Sphingopyxis sp. H071]KTE58680.1 disulfide bond formation protein DsbA [Sphingopyxis sp. H107]KTE64055.1 disulfide bond formation protein DsbA [Sphingopyxis sp. H100]